MHGRIKTLKQESGYGFIKGDNNQDYFFHHSGLAGGLRLNVLREGDAVNFDEEAGPKGPRAIDIELAA